jgi:uncharacterized protein YeaO (DUF488 family)
MIRLKRVYEPPSAGDGWRVLVDRLWPRGLTKEQAALDVWAKEIAPSDALRRWFGHEPGKWDEFRKRYFAELDGHPEAVGRLLRPAAGGPITLLFAARDAERNNAVALREYLQERLRREAAGSAGAAADGAKEA